MHVFCHHTVAQEVKRHVMKIRTHALAGKRFNIICFKELRTADRNGNARFRTNLRPVWGTHIGQCRSCWTVVPISA
eukprot:1787199-Amphidinium_carterae.1